MNLIDLSETGLIPDVLIRAGVRRLLRQRLRQLHVAGSIVDFARSLCDQPLAIATEQANEQHYQVPTEFFEQVLGPRLKYSACYFPTRETKLGDAEVAMLRRTCERAQIGDGMRILELGCGWGSLTLWVAEQFPEATITAVSNSSSQRRYIERQVQARALSNVRVITADMREFDTSDRFDRIVSVEMLEHLRNYQLLFQRVARWLNPEGKAFVHIFCHRVTPYLFETEGTTNWMGRHFFTGGMMPAEHLFRHFDEDLAIERQWRISGLHYWRTCEAWLRNLDCHRPQIMERFCAELPRQEAKRQLQRWRIFFMACAELFRYRNGGEWFVCHYRFRQAKVAPPRGARLQQTGSSEP